MTESIDTPPIPNHDQALMLAVELNTLDELIRYDGLNYNGLTQCHTKITSKHTIDVAMTRPMLAVHLERVLHRCVIALSMISGVPPEYWTDRPLEVAPDDASDLQ